MKVLFRTIEFLAAATAVLIAVIVIFGYFQVGVPVAKFDLRCSPIFLDGDETPEEFENRRNSQIWNFYETVDNFAIQNDGRIAYVDIEVVASDSARGCRIFKRETAKIGEDGEEVFQQAWIDQNEDAWTGDFGFTLRGPYGGSWRLDVPVNQMELPKNGQYKAIDHGRLLSVEGPFFVEHLEANGIGLVTLHPQSERVLSEAEISCARFRLNAPEWVRFLIPCF